MKKESRILVLMVILACLLVFTACSSQDASKAAGDNVLKVGAILPITGDQAKVGQEMIDSCKMALEEVNYKVGDYTIELIPVDHTTDPEKGSLAMEQSIIKDGIEVGLFNWSSSVGVSLMDVVAKYKIPYYFPFATTGTIDDKWNSDPEKHSYYIAKSWARPENMADAYSILLDSAIKEGTWKPRNNKVAIFGEDSDFGRSISANIRNQLVKSGWEVVYEEYSAMSTTDFYAQLNKIKSSDASLMAGSISAPASAAAFIKQAREINVNALIIAEALGDIANFYELTGDASNLVIDMRPKFSTQEGHDFAAAFKDKYGYFPAAASGGLTYDYTRFFIKCCEDTLEKYGELNSDTLYKYAQEVLLVGGITFDNGVVCPRYRFDKNSEFAPGPICGEEDFVFQVVQYYNGEAKTIWPYSQKEAELVIPDYAK